MMEVDILASGSSGNCIAVQSESTTILIDAGIAKTKIEKRLLELGIRPDHIEGIFITHAHKDHTKGLPLSEKYTIPVYASEGEWKDIHGVDDGLRGILKRSSVLFDYEGYGEWLEVKPFRVHHDAYDPLGYTIQTPEKKLSVCLDTGKVDSEMLEIMSDSDIYIIEANHDPDMVADSDYPDSVKMRILSDVGHLSNIQAAHALSRLIRGRGEHIFLTHLSSNNNLPALAEMTVKKVLERKGFKAGKHYFLEVV